MDDQFEPSSNDGSEIQPSSGAGSLLPFEDLVAPQPLAPDPPPSARVFAFGSILLGGLLGALIGYGVGDLLGGTENWAAVGGLIGGLIGAIGVAVVANLALRAMNEWKAVEHPEADPVEADSARADPEQN